MRAVVLGLGIVGRQQVLEHLAQQFRVERDVLFDRRVLGDREFVIVENSNQPAHLVAFAACAVDRVQIDLCRPAEEQIIGHVKRVLGLVGKAVDPYFAAMRHPRGRGTQTGRR